ncbi:MAG: hypothetical protein ACRDJO_08320 [Actinomycetota bacterium]
MNARIALAIISLVVFWFGVVDSSANTIATSLGAVGLFLFFFAVTRVGVKRFLDSPLSRRRPPQVVAMVGLALIVIVLPDPIRAWVSGSVACFAMGLALLPADILHRLGHDS